MTRAAQHTHRAPKGWSRLLAVLLGTAATSCGEPQCPNLTYEPCADYGVPEEVDAQYCDECGTIWTCTELVFQDGDEPVYRLMLHYGLCDPDDFPTTRAADPPDAVVHRP